MSVRDGLPPASPVSTSSARWLVHTVRSRMRFFSRCTSTTSTRAEIASPAFTGLRETRVRAAGRRRVARLRRLEEPELLRDVDCPRPGQARTDDRRDQARGPDAWRDRL